MDALETLRVSANESDLIPGCDGLPTRPSCVLTPSEVTILLSEQLAYHSYCMIVSSLPLPPRPGYGT